MQSAPNFTIRREIIFSSLCNNGFPKMPVLSISDKHFVQWLHSISFSFLDFADYWDVKSWELWVQWVSCISRAIVTCLKCANGALVDIIKELNKTDIFNLYRKSHIYTALKHSLKMIIGISHKLDVAWLLCNGNEIVLMQYDSCCPWKVGWLLNPKRWLLDF